MPNDNIIQDLRKIVASGTEEQATQYIQDHFQQFPKDIQQRLVAGMAADAAKAELAERMAVADIKSQILSLLKEFDALDKAGK
jgi:hypothetical protein